LTWWFARSPYDFRVTSVRASYGVRVTFRMRIVRIARRVSQHTPLHSSGMPGGRLRRCAPSRPLTQRRRRGAVSYKARRFGSHWRMTRLSVFSSGNQSVRIAVSDHGVEGQSGRGRLGFVWRTTILCGLGHHRGRLGSLIDKERPLLLCNEHVRGDDQQAHYQDDRSGGASSGACAVTAAA